MSQAKQQEWAARVAQGESLAAIAKSEGVSRQRVHQVVGGSRPATDDTPRERFVGFMDAALYDRAVVMAEERGLLVTRGPKAGTGNPFLLLEEIAAGRIRLR